MQLHRLSLTVLAASLLLVSTAACGGASCPQGRVKNVDGVCVRDQIADFVECINNAGGKTISREQALRIAASAGSYAEASYDQREAVRSQYEGPNERNQRLVIDHCVRMTQGAEQSPTASPALDTQLVQAALDERSDEMFKQRFLTTLTRQPVNDALCQARHRLPRGYTFPMNSCSSLSNVRDF